MSTDTSYFSDVPMRLGNCTQLLLDDHIVEDRWKLERILQQPEKHARNPVLLRDKPWEGDMAYQPNAFWDDERGCYRMWYQCFSRSNYHGAGPPCYVCYAESSDGYEWHKPLFDVCDFPGFDQTNVVYCGTYYPRAQGVQVFKDLDDPDPSRRYKMICLERYLRDGSLASGVGLVCSPDGLRWTLADGNPILDYHSDCHNHVVYDPGARRWLLYCRPIHMFAAGRRRPEGQTGNRHMRRRIAVMTSEDCETWSYPRVILYPDERDTPDYDSALVFRYGGRFLMLYSAMEGEYTGRNEVRLASSRDGLRWERFHTREPFLPRGPEGAWDAGQTRASSEPVRQGEDLLFYYWGTSQPQYAPSDVGGIGLATLKVDRFVEQRAGDQTGFLLTREFLLEGSRLEINAVAPGMNYKEQRIRVEIVRRPRLGDHAADFSPLPYEGFGLEECDPITATRTDIPVTWKGRADLSELRGKPVYLRFEIRNMGLFSFRIGEEAEEFIIT